MKRSTKTLVLASSVGVLALMLFALLVPTNGSEYAWFARFMRNPRERAAYERWFATRDTARSLRLELEQVEAVELAAQARGRQGGTRGGSTPDRDSGATLTIISGPMVGEQARARVTAAVHSELAALGVSAPRQPVAVILVRDSTLRLHYRRTVVLPRQGGAPCTVLVRERGRSAAFAGVAPNDRLLGACAFFAMYGEPGRGMLDWLSRSRMATAAFLLSPAELAQWRERPTGVNPASVSASGVSSFVAACRAGRTEACLRQFNGDEVEALMGYFSSSLSERVPWVHFDGVASYDPNSFNALGAGAQLSEGLLGALAADLGPAAFARVWVSDSVPSAAYAAEAGEPLDAWVARRLERLVEEYHAGPLPPVSGMATLMVLLAAIVGGTMALVRRRLS